MIGVKLQPSTIDDDEAGETFMERRYKQYLRNLSWNSPKNRTFKIS
jgi:hypothetical protein